MHPDEANASSGRALSPEEVGARVSAILEAAERDARAVIDAAQRDARSPVRAQTTLDQLATEVDALAARVSALERGLAQRPAHDAGAASETALPAAERRERRAAVVDAAARVRAIELALAGYSRDAIARELASTLPPAEIEGVLDEVLR
jgi:outer membrane murein-binding lipoprotein Lpp